MADESGLNGQGVSRRSILKSAALTPAAALVPVSALTAPAVAAAQTRKATAPALSVGQRRILDAVVDTLIPHDETGPGALESGVSDYIESYMAGFGATEKGGFSQGLEAIDAFARSTYSGGFAELTPEKREECLSALEANKGTGFQPNSQTFFNRVRRLTLEGMFGDPFYGGNKGFAGWDLLRYPGPRLGVSPDDQKTEMPKPYRQSAYGSKYGH